MEADDVTVECYSGYRGDQEPRRFPVGEARVEVVEIESRWREPGRRGFRVLGADGQRYRLIHDEVPDSWSVEPDRLAY